MTAPGRELAEDWLRKAHNDLVTAAQTLALEDGPTDTPCFHAQQAVEKSLKALLTVRGTAFPRSHDLLQLLDLALPALAELETYRAQLAQITGYGVWVRYPGVSSEPSRDDAREAVDVAERVHAVIARHLRAATR